MSKEANEMQQHMDRYELFFKKRYKVLHTVNDFLIGLLFFVGSFFFFSATLKPAGIWLFVIGSFQLMTRPAIRFIHDVHYRRYLERRLMRTNSD
ncbi:MULTISPECIES: YrhK family protein [Bacillus]|uniref:YrhK family protein n=1 Tax=Bacillus TaxID=1386 RepID=UPI0003F75966|nr:MULTISPECIES: YrhK family protein [Bacillus]QHZ47823.1 hypothetical protein M654_016755 [Bacillus sp. NSP9.1]WFA03902.1 YrhK family protein [Bacillus sp. HSf4]